MTAKTNKSAKKLAERKLVITRTFDAPREIVFKMWTDPNHMAQWWGPHGFTNPVCVLDVRPGGAILIDIRAGGNRTDFQCSRCQSFESAHQQGRDEGLVFRPERIQGGSGL